MGNQHALIRSTMALTALALLAGVSAVAAAEPDQSKAVRGAGIFRSYCASCHGTTAVGDGEVAEWLKVKPANLTEIAKRSDGEYDLEKIQKIIDGRTRVKGHGQGQMPIWGDAFQVSDGGNTMDVVTDRIENLAHFIWTLQK